MMFLSSCCKTKSLPLNSLTLSSLFSSSSFYSAYGLYGSNISSEFSKSSQRNFSILSSMKEKENNYPLLAYFISRGGFIINIVIIIIN
jgi:hypothetical protein